MLNKSVKILLLLIITGSVLITVPGNASAQYYKVSGVVDFTYRNYGTKTGDNWSRSDYWVQHYQANLGGFVWDPRFLLFSSGVGYEVYTTNAGSDSDALNYSLSTSFFPGRMVSWDVFGSRTTSTVDSLTSGTTNIAGYDVNTTSYGANLNLRLSSLGKGGRRYNNNRNNNNNNNNNNNSSDGLSLPLPDLSFSRVHTDSESLSESSPYHEVRDNTRLDFVLRRSLYDLRLDGAIEDYVDKIDNSSYTTKTGQLASRIIVSKDAELTLSGHVTDRRTENMDDFDSLDKVQSYTALLKFKEQGNLQHYYQYDYYAQDTTSLNYDKHNFTGTAIYKFSQEFEGRTGLNYSNWDYHSNASDGTSAESSTLQEGSLLLGANYKKQYKPDFMKAFSINTSYDYSLGFSDYTDEVNSANSTNGWYYTNSAGLGLQSLGWVRETLSFDYNIGNKRDHSHIENNEKNQSLMVNFSSSRIPKTTVNISGNYRVTDNRSALGSFFATDSSGYSAEEGFSYYQRSGSYNVSINHRISTYVSADLGASQGDTISNVYTLSTLTTSSNTGSNTSSTDIAEFVSANLAYPFGRNLNTRLMAREEFRTTDTHEGTVTRTESRYGIFNVDYRYRAIFVTFEYRWRQDIPDDSQRTTQQYMYLKVARPF